MDYPTEFIPIYDQTQEQAKKMVDKLFEENAELRARLVEVKGWQRKSEKMVHPVEAHEWAELDNILSDTGALAKRTEEK